MDEPEFNLTTSSLKSIETNILEIFNEPMMDKDGFCLGNDLTITNNMTIDLTKTIEIINLSSEDSPGFQSTSLNRINADSSSPLVNGITPIELPTKVKVARKRSTPESVFVVIPKRSRKNSSSEFKKANVNEVQKFQIKFPRLTGSIKVDVPYRPLFFSFPAEKLEESWLASHNNNPIHISSSISAKDAVNRLESCKDRILNQEMTGYELRRFIITTTGGEPIEPYIYDNFANGLLFKGTLFGKQKAAGVHDGKINKILIRRPNPECFAIQVYTQSPAYPGINFRLRQPKHGYRDIYQEFIWHAYLVQNVREWLEEFPNSTYDHLRNIFSNWLEKKFHLDEEYISWKKEYSAGGDYSHFLPKARYLLHMQISDPSKYPILSNKLLRIYIDEVENIKGPKEVEVSEKTLVTPKVYRWFKHLFGNQMRTLNSCDENVTNNVNPFNPPNNTWDFENPRIIKDDQGKMIGVEVKEGQIKIGDFVEIESDDNDENDIWIARITSFQEDDSIKFRLIWMYNYKHTVLERMSTHCEAELFYTTHCECRNQPFPLSFIKQKVEVNLGPIEDNSLINNSYFCRFFYDEVETAFIDLKQALIEDFTGQLLCTCTVPSSIKLRKKVVLLDQQQMGRTFLLDLSSQPGMEYISPIKELLTIGQLIAYDNATQLFTFRVFPRFLETYSFMKENNHPVNLPESYSPGLHEVLYSSIIIQCPQICIMSTCKVEYWPWKTPKENMPTYLLHRGAGNLFYFSYTSSSDLCSITQPSEDQNGFFQHQFPAKPLLMSETIPLKALDLFSGSGSLGLGVGDSGLAQSRWAVDFETAATEAYKLNHPKDKPIRLFTESVNTSLRKVFEGHPLYPKKGQVDMIMAGTPCQGYSLLNRHRESPGSLLKSSMITSLASFVDHFRPTYVLLEQISNFIRFRLDSAKGAQNKYPFNALIAFFLSLGYQVRFKVLAASNHGTCQNRNRVFIWCTALGHQLPFLPNASHLNHFNNTFTIPLPTRERTEAHQAPGKAPLPPITVRDTIGDLPPLGHFTSCQDSSISFHHITEPREIYQNRLEKIPLSTLEANARGLCKRYRAFNLPGLLPERLQDGYDKRKLKQFCSRVDPNGQITTISTAMNVVSTFPSIHYAEPRHLTVREVARMQGFLDSDSFYGSIPDQYKLIGNAVPRCVGFALGSEIKPYIDSCYLKKIVKEFKSSPNNVPKETITDECGVKIWFQDKAFLFSREIFEDTIPDVFLNISREIVDLKDVPFRLIFKSSNDKDFILIDDQSSLIKVFSVASDSTITSSGKIICLPILLDANISELLEEYTKENIAMSDNESE